MEALMKIMHNPKVLAPFDGLRRRGLRIFYPSANSCELQAPNSAVAQLVVSIEDLPSQLEAELPAKRPMQPARVTTKLHELDQRRKRHAEHVKQLSWMLYKRPVRNLDMQMPFTKQPSDVRCNPYTNVKALLKREHDPKKLAKEMTTLAKELIAERRKNETLLENYRELEMRLFQYSNKENKSRSTAQGISVTSGFKQGDQINEVVKQEIEVKV